MMRFIRKLNLALLLGHPVLWTDRYLWCKLVLWQWECLFLITSTSCKIVT